MADEIENGQKAKPEKMLSDEQKAKLAESQGVTDAEIADGDPDGSLEQKDIDTPIDNKGSKFETFFDAPYSEIKVVLRDTIKPDQRIIDLGANKGNLEDFLDTLDIPVAVECVDTDQQALEELKAKQFENLQIEVAPMDANDFVDGYTGDNVDIALVNATLHEINTPSDQRQYLQHFFERMRAILKQEGRVIVGDYYYPDSVTDEEVASFIEYQKKAINHADAREKFVKPELLCEIGQESGFLVEHTKEIRAVKEIDRRYYIVVLRKQ